MKNLVVSGIVFLCAFLGLSHAGLSAQASAPRGELRVVDRHPWNWVWIAWNVMEHLVELDTDGAMAPRRAKGTVGGI